MRLLLISFFFIVPMTSIAGSFFPSNYKQFAFKEGDLLVSKRSDEKFGINKILKVDRFEIKAGSSISIQGRIFTATEDDYLLVVSTAFGESEFNSFEEARVAAQAGKWRVEIAHVPNRTPGAAVGQTYVGHQAVSDEELVGYAQWRRAFEKGSAGIF